MINITTNFVQGKVRKEMNYLLGIKVDKDILQGGFSPPQEALDLWEDDEQGKGPTLKHMKPDWNNLHSLWNCRLEELFCAHFCQKMEIVDEDLEDDVRDMFRQRLARLLRLMKKDLPRPGETTDQTAARVHKTSAGMLARQRPNSRRREVSKIPAIVYLAEINRPESCICHALTSRWQTEKPLMATLTLHGMSFTRS